MNSAKTVLIIEDEQDISRIVNDYLRVQGFSTFITENAGDGLQAVRHRQPDFIILDLTLPDADGIEVCRKLRTLTAAPILILSARSSDTDKVLALGFGADDYMTKPFSLSELVARVQAHLRRIADPKLQVSPQQRLQFGALSIDKNARKVMAGQLEISLSAKEFDLLYFLASNPNQVFTKSQLLDHVWGYSAYVEDNTITVYIRRLRDKLERTEIKSSYIKTVWGVGYKFTPDGDE
ncbi:Response regulator ArlR [Paenibacillus sp. GM2FR]|uniref:response regulator transcription factor n=1 Tax=Paenibacillus TaxID=44249 RepID=UPI000C27B953|nr:MULTISPECIES: response regulator transcription factor [Paenibacillus]MEC0258187.1 response regulator transcription factor [Paenibacillus lautus]MEC0308833.1 response regulator transcription factor [Paenibacillus lautus]PJN56814.1 Response regulator ArlR [Paenibacillus sp. GM2FR]